MAWRSDVGDYLVAHQKIRREHHPIWLRARRANSVQSAYRILKRNLPDERIPEPWASKLKHQHKPLRTTSQYTKGNSDPRTFARREPVPTGAVESFGPDTYKPRRKTRRRPAYMGALHTTVSPERVCKSCGTTECRTH
jgi:hypothetical protein